MMWRAITLLILLLTAVPGRADVPLMGSDGSGRLCRPAISSAERSHAIPSHLLAAIAHVESGRKDPASGAFNPWPWTVNAEGQGYFYDSKAQAVAAVATMRRQGIRSIDVGCMQISLLHHPDAFPGLEQAFDPTANANYGAQFLNELHDKTNSWPKAVEFYHSATPELGQDYGRKVYAALPDEQRLAGLSPFDNLAAAWSATIPRSPFGGFRASPARVILLPATAQPGIGPGGIGPGGIGPRGTGLQASGQAGIGLGGSGLGRSLQSYRMTPVRLAFRAP
ncbi:lytic transglycosylase domain-containing protein [Rhodopila sp.]|uniref:lytic transglycosylase domain-containing protein n=1 Tax=Rhodopila sp. TaxID=2480087 RepID=UPI003D0A7A92